MKFEYCSNLKFLTPINNYYCSLLCGFKPCTNVYWMVNNGNNKYYFLLYMYVCQEKEHETVNDWLLTVMLLLNISLLEVWI